MMLTPSTPANRTLDARLLLYVAAVVIPALLSGCATPARGPITSQPAARPYVAPPGLERVMGKTPAQIVALLGSPRLDRQEGKTRQLQYKSMNCVLDLFAVGTMVTYAEARTPTGLRFDPVACLALLAPH